MTSTAFPNQRPWSLDAADALLNLGGGRPEYVLLAQEQLKAAVALQRMLLEQGIAYLGDEVGMGKTYVALAVVAMMRHLNPNFRVLYLVPSRNVLIKWYERELPAFIRDNLRLPNDQVKAAAGFDLNSAAACASVSDWVRVARAPKRFHDTFLRFSALSFDLPDDEAKCKELLYALAEQAGEPASLTGIRTKNAFKKRAAQIVNSILPKYDLVIVDEAHLLKGGSGPDAPYRAQFLANALGSLGSDGSQRFRGALLLSGTPFDRDLHQLARQMAFFAPRGKGTPPHVRIAKLADQRRSGSGWQEIHQGLEPFLIRRVQKLPVGGQLLSRNQYRIEHRKEAGISLKGDSPDVLKQRLFTALVQKRLIEHLGSEHGGAFPQAMFSAWEAYTPPKTNPVKSGTRNPGTGRSGQQVDPMDVERKGSHVHDSTARDTELIQVLVESHKQMFKNARPPHPKLESEAKRIGADAFCNGNKQLVFVRRLKSVSDLSWRLNREYDHWLVQYLETQGLLDFDAWKPVLKKFGDPDEQTASSAEGDAQQNDKTNDGPPPATKDSLFTWFFRGKLDRDGEAFIRRYQLPSPELLRERLREQDNWECLIGELDWRGFIRKHAGLPVEVSYEELAEYASTIPGAKNKLDRYRRLQYAFAHLAAKRCSGQNAHLLTSIAEYYRSCLNIKTTEKPAQIQAATAKRLLSCPTVPLSLVMDEKASSALPLWQETWQILSKAHDRNEAQRQLRSLDLYSEVLFALLRLNHPFIDLYLSWQSSASASGRRGAEVLVNRVVQTLQSDTGQFGTARVMHDLATGWPQVLKTNFADFADGKRAAERSHWRQSIQQLLGHFSPVEWASGDNTDGRVHIARRFRMPGYPMALVSTSVLQEGEDLHVFCDRVTHFGITGSPIGIEQKNGRVDRIGSLAQRNLYHYPSIAEHGIRIWFPHLVESLEWYQIRELCLRLNDYLRSMHTILPAKWEGHQQQLSDVVASDEPIPPQLKEGLESPFEPDDRIFPANNAIQFKEVTARIASLCDHIAKSAEQEVRRQPENSAHPHVLHGVLERCRLQTDMNRSRKWTPVHYLRPEFYKNFNTWRLGKLYGDGFYVTVPALASDARELIAELDLKELVSASTSGKRAGVLYPGFNFRLCSEDQLLRIFQNLVGRVDALIADTRARSG